MSSGLTAVPQYVIPLALDGGDYSHSGSAPTSFNLIDAYNMTDRIGLLNDFVAAVPLSSPPSATLFTGALRYLREYTAKCSITRISVMRSQ